MPEFDTGAFARSVAGQLLRRLAESDPGGAPPDPKTLNTHETAALIELERLGYVSLVRGTGAFAWRIDKLALTNEGRARIERDKR
jgi:hypothetical protein